MKSQRATPLRHLVVLNLGEPYRRSTTGRYARCHPPHARDGTAGHLPRGARLRLPLVRHRTCCCSPSKPSLLVEVAGLAPGEAPRLRRVLNEQDDVLAHLMLLAARSNPGQSAAERPLRRDSGDRTCRLPSHQVPHRRRTGSRARGPLRPVREPAPAESTSTWTGISRRRSRCGACPVGEPQRLPLRPVVQGRAAGSPRTKNGVSRHRVERAKQTPERDRAQPGRDRPPLWLLEPVRTSPRPSTRFWLDPDVLADLGALRPALTPAMSANGASRRPISARRPHPVARTRKAARRAFATFRAPSRS